MTDVGNLVVGINGYSRAGKDTAAGALYPLGFRRLAFADVLKDLATRLGWDGQKDAQGVALLVNLGQGARDILYSDVWVDPIQRQLVAAPHTPFVITDMRYPNEMEMVTNFDAHRTLRIVRPGTRALSSADSALEEADFDAVIVNDGTVADLHRKVLAAL